MDAQQAAQDAARRQKEGRYINKSLHALKGVIVALAERSAHVPFRDSVLTKLLNHCIGGSASTHLIVHASPSSMSFNETKSTLFFAGQVREREREKEREKRREKRERERQWCHTVS